MSDDQWRCCTCGFETYDMRELACRDWRWCPYYAQARATDSLPPDHKDYERIAERMLENIEYDLADRMAKSSLDAGLTITEMAQHLDVETFHIANWINRRITPSDTVLSLWAAKTGVSYEWLRNGSE